MSDEPNSSIKQSTIAGEAVAPDQRAAAAAEDQPADSIPTPATPLDSLPEDAGALSPDSKPGSKPDSAELAASDEVLDETPSAEVETAEAGDEATSTEADTPQPESKQDDASDQPAAAQAEPEPSMDWYILKVQSNRENSIAESLQRRVKISGLESQFGEIIVPTEMVTEFKGGKKRIVRRKLYPGYLVAQMAITDDTWFLVRETPGIGDFTGAGGKPTPMLPHEVQRIVAKEDEKHEKAPSLQFSFKTGDRVKINEGTFDNFEGEVSTLDEASGRVTVMINIFGRSTPVELEYWQVESV